MATTTARLTINSSDLTSAPLSLTTTNTLHKSGGCTGIDVIEQGTKRSAAAGNVTVLDADLSGASWTANGSNKVYIANLSTSTTEYWTIKLDSTTAEEIGRLYGGDWMFIPWAADTADDIIATSSDTNMELEYIVFSDRV
jgi:hypothetical protein